MTCKPRKISGNEPISAISKDYNRYCDRIVGNGGTLFLQAETIAFAERVIADGGTVEDISFLNSFILDAKTNGYFNDIVAAYSPSWGVKGGATASDLYSITGATKDMTQPVGVNQPAINLADLNGKTRLLADGVNCFMNTTVLSWPQPFTNIYMGYESESWTSQDHVSNGTMAGAAEVLQFTATPDVYLFSGTLLGPNSGAVLNTPVNLRVLFDTVSSEIQVDSGSIVSGNSGAGVADGMFLFSDHLGGKNIHASLGAVVILDSPNDANYAAKMTAIKNFSASAYGTV